MSTLMSVQGLRERASDEGRIPVSGRPASATLALGPDWAELPSATELAALLLQVPVAGVRLVDPVDFSKLPGHVIVRIIALIRECSSIGARVTWSLILDTTQLDLVRRLDHLPAPGSTTVLGKGIRPVDEWRSSRHFGLLYFRKGPQFLSVVDQRPESSRELILDDPVLMDVFLQGLEGCAWAEAVRDARYTAALRDLESRDLAMRFEDHFVTLPVHMHSWPLGAALLGGTLASAGKKKQEDDSE